MLNQWERLGSKRRTGRSLPLLLIEISTQVVAFHGDLTTLRKRSCASPARTVSARLHGPTWQTVESVG
jgi:hypothetical protein